jgi:hypothetical protein
MTAPALPSCLGHCVRCGGSQYMASQVPVCGYCAIVELAADRTWRRYRVKQPVLAARAILARSSTRALREVLPQLSSYQIRGVRRRLKKQATT